MRNVKVFGSFVLLSVVLSFVAVGSVSASYQRIAPGDAVTLGEFVFDDDFVPTTTPCTIGINDPSDAVVIPSTTAMTANNDGWHYYEYVTAGNATSGMWPSVMICGSVVNGDLVKVDKSFIVDPAVLSTSTLKAVVDESLETATSSLASAITAGTNAVNANTDAQIASVSSSLSATIQSASSSLFASLPAAIWSFSGRTLTSFGTLVADTVTAVWSASTRTLTGFGTLVADVWTNTTRTLTGANLDSGSLATLSDVQTATSSLASAISAGTSAVNSNTDTQILSASSSLATRIDSAVSTGWTVTLSDFGQTTVNTAYKAKLQVLDHGSIPTDADALPTVVITDPVGTVQVLAGVMTKDSDGTYSYSYSIGGSAIGGVWETVVSAVIGGETVRLVDYWSLSSSPADVQIIEITDKVIPTITAHVRIDNMGTSDSDFYYAYCIVSSEDNVCGGGDDVDSGSDTAYIVAGSFLDLFLTLDDVPTAGTYWFKVKARALSEPNWASSTEQFIAESGTTPPPPPPDGGGGGGGGGGTTGSDTKVVFSGWAYPNSKVILLKDAQIAASVFADSNTVFSITLPGLSGGSYVFGLYAEDSSGRRSALVTYPITILTGTTVSRTGIFITPTIAVDKSEMKSGEPLTIFGYAAPEADITIMTYSASEYVGKTQSAARGAYEYQLDTAQMPHGQYYTKAKATKSGVTSPFSQAIGFVVGTETVDIEPPGICPGKADLNSDCRVNLVDFSIAAYWYKRPLSDAFKFLEATKLSGDGKVDLIDFSIMAYYWTG
ncbi:hypothetical protein KJ781_01635 [Patescibacteria group bacterium]|nr:hypothetical protein [Patescibacteria group bacterium]MBU1448983.1 hypothetical protein [Patescibacteria group bacterium]MBU2613456.1 hypothetical protein [Patescibacteria group bacterium]